jgi:ABC-type sugar transport system ATPase subunit
LLYAVLVVRVVTEKVGKCFGEVVALRDVSLQLIPGERVAVLGPSGSGKTTLLRLIAGLEMPSSGAVQIQDHPVSGPVDGVAMVFQNLALFPHLTGCENIALGLRARKLPRAEITRRIDELAELLSIGAILSRRPHQLSAGERQRVALARALSKRPSVLLLDEPFANLDWHLRAEFRAELKRLHSRFAMTMVCVTHDLLEAVILGQRIAVLNRGLLEQFDAPERLLDNPASPFVKSFFVLPEIPALARQLLRDPAPAGTLEEA